MHRLKIPLFLFVGLSALVFAGCVGITMSNVNTVTDEEKAPLHLARPLKMEWKGPLGNRMAGLTVLPSGIYKATLADKEGIYYQAPKLVIVQGQVLTGGFFLPEHHKNCQGAMLWIVNVHSGVNRFPIANIDELKASLGYQ